MVARNFPEQEIPYSRLLQVPEDDRDFITLEELKPAIHHHHHHHQSLHQYQQQQQQQHQQPIYYELTNISDAGCSSYQQQQSNPPSSSSTKTIMELQPVDSSYSCSSSSGRKRKISCHDPSSDLEEENSEDVKSVKTSDENKKQNHSEIEKRRRDKMNTYITELSAMVPMCHAMSRKLDKLTVLRMAVQHLKTIRGAVHSYTEGHYKPSFLSDQELKHLILQAVDGFLFVVGCDRGRILYVSASVSKVLNFSQGALLGQSLFDILHPKDVAKVKEQLSSSDLNPRERLIDAKTMLPVKTDVPQGATRLCPGARRSFFCRMKCQVSSAQVKEEADTTTGCHRRKKQQSSSDKKYNVIQCTGYLKSWAPAKIGLEEQETDGDAESSSSCNLSCLVAVGRILPHISTVAAVNNPSQSGAIKPNVRPVQFISRHTLDGKFLFIDQRATLVLGFLPQELLGSSMYEYYHHDDITVVAECHKCALQSTDRVTTKIYRFRTKDGGYVRLQTEWKSFKNPWTKEIEYLIAKNKLVLTDFLTVESTAGRASSDASNISKNFEFFTQNNEKDIQRMIDSHVEASKIGRQIAEQVIDSQRRCTDGESPQDTSPDPESDPPPLAILSSNDVSLISTSATAAQSDQQILQQQQQQQQHDFSQQNYTIRNNVSLSSVAVVNNDQSSVGPQECVVYALDENTTTTTTATTTTADGIIEMMEDAVRETSATNNSVPPTNCNDEAAMAVIMSLLEADAGLGGPVDFSGLPWPLP